MSLNKSLDRLFDEIRREAKRNADFADRLDAVLRLHESRRDVSDEAMEEAARPDSSPESGGGVRAKRDRMGDGPGASIAETGAAPGLNPVGMFKREGEDALLAALAAHELGALRALVCEHDLDPGGVTPTLSRDELAAHVVAQAKRRAERDDKMFDY